MPGADYSSWKVADLKAALKSKVGLLNILSTYAVFLGVSPRVNDVRTSLHLFLCFRCCRCPVTSRISSRDSSHLSWTMETTSWTRFDTV